MSEGWLLFYIWLSGFILSLPLCIYWMNYKDEDGNTVVDLRRIIIILSCAIIANWAVVALFAWCAGMWILVKIGEILEPLGDITFYKSAPTNLKKIGKKRNKK